MVPSIYVIQKSSGQLYCVNVKHYEVYKHWYDVADLQTPVEPAVEEETPAGAVDIEMVVENKQVKTRKPRGK
jgi:hypothetical protein